MDVWRLRLRLGRGHREGWGCWGGLCCSKDYPPNSGTTAPESAPKMSEVETPVAAPLPFVSLDRHLTQGGGWQCTSIYITIVFICYTCSIVQLILITS